MAAARSPQYMALNHNASEIRLFTFERTKDGAIRGRLHVFPIAECPTYVAVSYTWGKEPPRRTIYLNGKKFRLRENIYQALKSILRLRARNGHGPNRLERKIQKPDLSRKAADCEYFWIDSICINQASRTEQSHQVGIMGQIFSNADFMIAWLGPESDRSVEVMQAIRTYKPSLIPNTGTLTFGIPPLTLHLIDMVEMFGSLEYWSRLWIVQEVILAKDILVSWGNEFLPWIKIHNVAFASVTPLAFSLATFEHAAQHTSEYERSWIKLVLQKERKNHVLRTRGRAVDDIGTMKSASLYGLIFEFADRGCMIPRDKVIGLLGLIPDDAAHLVDYSMPDEEYFREVCKYAFTAAEINGSETKIRFQRILGESLGISASVYSSV